MKKSLSPLWRPMVVGILRWHLRNLNVMAPFYPRLLILANDIERPL